jgi:hypothetical protein
VNRRQTLLAAAVVVALVIVAIGAGARGSARVGVSGGHDVVVAAVIVAALALVGWAFGKASPHRLRAQLPGALALVAVLAVLVGLAVLFVHFFHGNAPPPRPHTDQGPLFPNQTAAPSGSPATQHGAALSTVPVVGVSLIVVLLVVGGVLAIVARKRRQRVDAIDDEGAARGAVYAAADAGADAMRDVLDPRAAIIACYAAMERVLAEAGVRRLVAETPGDLLGRAIEMDIAPDAARSLTALFLEARYSTHPMNEADREAARAALMQLRTPEAAASAGESLPSAAPSGTGWANV